MRRYRSSLCLHLQFYTYLVSSPEGLNRPCCLVLLEETPCEKPARDCLYGVGRKVKLALIDVIARITQVVSTLTTIGGPLVTALTLRPANSLVFVETAETENLCRLNGILTTWTTRHWIAEREVQAFLLQTLQIYQKKGFSFFFFWVVALLCGFCVYSSSAVISVQREPRSSSWSSSGP